MKSEHESDWWAWATAVAGTHVYAAIAEQMSTVESITAEAVAKWARGARPRADTAVSFARAYGESPILALVVAGYATTQEAHSFAVGSRAETLPDDEIARQFLKRFRHLGSENVDGPGNSPTTLPDGIENGQSSRPDWKRPRRDATPI